MKKILYALTAALLLMYGCANEKDNNTSAAAAPDLKDDFMNQLIMTSYHHGLFLQMNHLSVILLR